MIVSSGFGHQQPCRRNWGAPGRPVAVRGRRYRGSEPCAPRRSAERGNGWGVTLRRLLDGHDECDPKTRTQSAIERVISRSLHAEVGRASRNGSPLGTAHPGDAPALAPIRVMWLCHQSRSVWRRASLNPKSLAALLRVRILTMLHGQSKGRRGIRRPSPIAAGVGVAVPPTELRRYLGRTVECAPAISTTPSTFLPGP